MDKCILTLTVGDKSFLQKRHPPGSHPLMLHRCCTDLATHVASMLVWYCRVHTPGLSSRSWLLQENRQHTAPFGVLQSMVGSW